EEEEDEDEEEEEPERGPRVAPRPRKGPRAVGRVGAKKKKVGKKAPPKPPEKKTVILDETFKAKVFAAFRKADAATAQQLCLDLVDGNEDYAKQIYGHLLDIAKRKNWV